MDTAAHGPLHLGTLLIPAAARSALPACHAHPSAPAPPPLQRPRTCRSLLHLGWTRTWRAGQVSKEISGQVMQTRGCLQG